ncbi:MAG: HlyD family type I secretion periplasmic adaptor subunit [Rhizobiales bacterium]|nr:HlyD family type I secretion periplasmic adaptor subunit [Hyphomicrobiales bacterium]NRB15341.1 HlyD family type I secretion periplasmic adaptor subunit [Hyphomicrobiales bacterium]
MNLPPATQNQKKAKQFGQSAAAGFSLNRLIMVGLFISLFGFGGFVYWGVTANLAKGVSAQGIIVVEGSRKTVQHLEGGIVKNIYIKDGDHVQQGDVLIRLDDIQIKSRADLIKIRLTTAIATLDRLFAEQKHANSLQFGQALLAQSVDANVVQIMQVQQTLFDARKLQLDGRGLILAQKIEQLNEIKLGLLAQKNAGLSQLILIDEELVRSEGLAKQQLVSLSDIGAKKSEKAQLEGEIGRLTAEISGANVTQGEAKLEILQLQKTFDQEVAQNILENREITFDLQSQLVNIEDVLKRLSIVAPQNGTIISLNVFTIGGVVAPASPILDIVPSQENLIIETKISALDIDNIYIDQKVRVRLSAFKMRSTPLLQGNVMSKSPDIIIDPQTKESYYLIRISLSDAELNKIDEQILPGMPTEILIETGSRTPLEYMLEPLEKVIERALKED